MTRQNQNSHFTFVDTASLFDASEALTATFGVTNKVGISYQSLFKRLQEKRRDIGMRPAEITSAFVAVDLASESQQRFVAMLERAGFFPDVNHYRDMFSSGPPGRAPSEGEKPRTSFSPRIAYLLGLLAQKEAPNVVVVSHAFELNWPLIDLIERSNAKVALAYFGSLVDYRWKSAGLFDVDSRISFIDLESMPDIFVGFEMPQKAAPQGARSGVSRFL